MSIGDYRTWWIQSSINSDFSRRLSKWVLKTSWNPPVVWRNSSCDLRESLQKQILRGRESWTRGWGKQDSWLLMANQFSLARKKFLNFQTFLVLRQTGGKFDALHGERNPQYYDFLLLKIHFPSHKRNIFVNAFDGEKKMKFLFPCSVLIVRNVQIGIKIVLLLGAVCQSHVSGTLFPLKSRRLTDLGGSPFVSTAHTARLRMKSLRSIQSMIDYWITLLRKTFPRILFHKFFCAYFKANNFLSFSKGDSFSRCLTFF